MSGGDGMPRRISRDVERDGTQASMLRVSGAGVGSSVRTNAASIAGMGAGRVSVAGCVLGMGLGVRRSSVRTNAAYGHPDASRSVDVYALNYIWFQEHNKK
jgi:hypothetical protein